MAQSRFAIFSVLAFGVAGAAILIALGVWQMQRLTWKEGVLADIEARIVAAPVTLPDAPDALRDRYLPVRLEGQFLGGEGDTLRVLVSRKGFGAGYRLISGFEDDLTGRRILVDRGFLPVAEEMRAAPAGDFGVTGNLHWPDDRNSSTPDNDRAANIWFARDLADMAAVLDTEPYLVVLRDSSPREADITPLPVDTSAIPNDHLEYAVTWFSLAAVWLGMTAYLLWRIRQRPV
ncbi:SURF1 family protein [Rhodobacteraceae bacterium XHP0102]|nr:SURF1 family protein [Rhodobacteraceae bacterium XHP0102]